ncbi:MAG: exodeoxyribonuclease VII small subunit [Oscillospiraceae bacterium]|nr:exodeoxyribonuclease VII small subunit [Oscillospiraceae bacterium]
MPKTKSQSFEASLERLEQIVHRLEDGAVPLEEAMKLFQEGTALAASCGKLLDQAELEVVKLTRDSNGRLEEVPFAHEDIE